MLDALVRQFRPRFIDIIQESIIDPVDAMCQLVIIFKANPGLEHLLMDVYRLCEIECEVV